MLKLFTSLKLEIEPKQLVLHFRQAMECMYAVNRIMLAICTLGEILRKKRGGNDGIQWNFYYSSSTGSPH